MVKQNFKSKPEGKGASQISVEMQRMIHETWNYNREGEPLVQEAVVLRRPQAQGILSELTERMRWVRYVVRIVTLRSIYTVLVACFFNPYLLLLAG